MAGLRDTVPDRDLVLQMRPEELGEILLTIVRPYIQNGMFLTEQVGKVSSSRGYNHFGYVDGNDPEVERATAHAWAWLERELLILPADGINGANGFKVLSWDGEKIVAKEIDFSHLRALASFPKSLLHPAIADKVYAALSRNDLDGAVDSPLDRWKKRSALPESLGRLMSALRSCALPSTRTRGRSLIKPNRTPSATPSPVYSLALSDLTKILTRIGRSASRI